MAEKPAYSFEPNSLLQPIIIKTSGKFLHLPPVVNPDQLQPSTIVHNHSEFQQIVFNRPQKNRLVPPAMSSEFEHIAPLPLMPIPMSRPSWKKLPAGPILRVIENTRDEVLLSWFVPMRLRQSVATIKSYQIFGYVLTTEKQPSSSNWKHVGTVETPFCKLIQLDSLEVYYFAVRAFDMHARVGPFSEPILVNLSLMERSTKPQQIRSLVPVLSVINLIRKHPAPLPSLPIQICHPSWGKFPKAPMLFIEEKGTDYVSLSWIQSLCDELTTIITTYQIFAYAVAPEDQPSSSHWIHIFTADTLFCRITQLDRSLIYYFAVRAVDIHNRTGPFSSHKMVNWN